MLTNLINYLVGKYVRPILRNWVTTFFGILALLPSLRIVLDDVQQTLLLLVDCAKGGVLDVPHLKVLVGAIGTAIGAGLVAARDAGKSTELSTLPLHALTDKTP